MRRLYVTTLETFHQHRDYYHPSFGAHCIFLFAHKNPQDLELMHSAPLAWEALDEVKAWRAAHSPLLLCTSFDHSEYCEDKWHSHPNVAILPHPTFEGNDPLSKHLDSVAKKLKQHHLDHLSVHGIKPEHTVWDVSDIASKLHPLVKLRAIL